MTISLDAWPDAARPRIEDALDRAPAGAVIAFDFDNTVIRGDVGETLHYRLAAEGGYAGTESFWAQIDPEDGRDRIRSSLARAPLDPDAILDLQAVFLRRLLRLGVAEAYRWAVTLHVDLDAARLHEAALRHAEHESMEPHRVEERTAPDGLRMRMSRGLARRPAVEALRDAARDAGLVDWVVSATNVWAIRAVAPTVGFDASRCLGNRCHEEAGRITARRDGPVTWRAGKVDALAAAAGARPWIAIGDSWTDAELLGAATRLAILVDRGDDALRSHAQTQGWLIVPEAQIEGHAGAELRLRRPS